MMTVMLMELIDSGNMDKAKERLKRAQEEGVAREVWHLFGSETSAYPNYNRGFFDKILRQKREFKAVAESEQDYISRLIESGRRIEFSGNLYVVKSSLGLCFKLRDEGIRETSEKVCFYNVAEDSTFGGILVELEDVAGIVPIRDHTFGLVYQGWDVAGNLQLSRGQMRNKPDKIVYHS